jgi:hypothetical protein
MFFLYNLIRTTEQKKLNEPEGPGLAVWWAGALSLPKAVLMRFSISLAS